MTARLVDMDDVARDPEAVRAWLHAHGLDPHRTVPGLVVRGDRIEATLYVLDAQGRKQLDRDGPAAPLVEFVDVPLRQPLPDHLGTEIP
jgi:hypothetical protein